MEHIILLFLAFYRSSYIMAIRLQPFTSSYSNKIKLALLSAFMLYCFLFPC